MDNKQSNMFTEPALYIGAIVGIALGILAYSYYEDSPDKPCDYCTNYPTPAEGDYKTFDEAKKLFVGISSMGRIESGMHEESHFRIEKKNAAGVYEQDSTKALYFSTEQILAILCAKDPDVGPTGIAISMAYDREEHKMLGIAVGVNKSATSSRRIEASPIYKSKILCPTHCDWCQ